MISLSRVPSLLNPTNFHPLSRQSSTRPLKSIHHLLLNSPLGYPNSSHHLRFYPIQLIQTPFFSTQSNFVESSPIIQPHLHDDHNRHLIKLDERRLANLIGYSKNDLRLDLEHFGFEPYRASQIFQWLYGHGVEQFEHMPNLGLLFREELKKHFKIESGKVANDRVSLDGTRKWLIDFGRDQLVETVFIPETRRGTLCLSSQIGCSMSCTFCYTGTQKLVRNLHASEIVDQIVIAKRLMFDFPRKQDRLITNIVFMGQGEPLYNYRQVKQAINILIDPEGLGISKRRITLSTSGIAPLIPQLGADFPGINLAISLHAVTDALRSQLVPANRQWPLAILLDACRKFSAINTSRRISFEYVMLAGINDSNQDANQLIQLIKGLPSLVNLIPFNPWPGTSYECSSHNRIYQFSRIIQQQGIAVTIRWSRGKDILAACGQLKSLETTVEEVDVEIEVE